MSKIEDLEDKKQAQVLTPQIKEFITTGKQFESILQGTNGPTKDRFMRVCTNMLLNSAHLKGCDIYSFKLAALSCAALGLDPDPALAYAHFVPFKDGRTQVTKVQFIPGYRGYIKLALNSPDLVEFAAHAVREKDGFEFELGLDPILKHKPLLSGDRGEITHFYAYAKRRDGGKAFEVMSVDDVNKQVRSKSSAYRYAMQNKKPGKDVDTPWVTHYEQMGRKSLIRRLAKYLPWEVLKQATYIEEQYEVGNNAYIDIPTDTVVVEPIDVKEADQSNLDAFAENKVDDLKVESPTQEENSPF